LKNVFLAKFKNPLISSGLCFCQFWLKGLKDIQTWIMDNLADFYVPSFKKKLPKSA